MTEAAAEADLRECERRLTTALAAHDIGVLSRIYAPDYVFTSAQGETWGRDRAMEEITDPELIVDRISIEIERIDAATGTVAGRSEVAAHIGPRDLSGVFRFWHTWRKSPDGWQLVAGRTTRD